VHYSNNEFEGGCLIQGQKTTLECAKSVAFLMVDKLNPFSKISTFSYGKSFVVSIQVGQRFFLPSHLEYIVVLKQGWVILSNLKEGIASHLVG
jgi:hypothetical protein